MDDTIRDATWIVLLAHGSADARWQRPFLDLRERIRQGAARPEVLLAYLQFCEPTLEQALSTCRSEGGRRVLVVPIFLSGGGHLLRDVPAAITRAAAQVPELYVVSTGALGEEPEVQEAMAQACLRLLEGFV